MREAFVNTLIEAAERDPKIYLLTADLGFTVFERFQSQFPNRFINVGVAEANLIGCASGLAREGFIPVVYSIANFVALRPFEQIRNDVCFPALPVKIVGVGAGLAYGHAGFTHHATEDIALMRSMPNMTILCPSGPMETAKCTEAILKQPGPAYLRLSKKGEADLVKDFANFGIGKATIMRKGNDAVLFACGIMLDNVLKCAELLSKSHHIEATVVNMHTVQPIDRHTIFELGRQIKRMVTVEEHGMTGGLGSAISEVLSERGDLAVCLMRCGIEDKFDAITGDRNYLLEKSHLMPDQLADRTLQFLGQTYSSKL